MTETWTNREWNFAPLHRFTRFRNLMSTAAGQKFLNENLHRTSVLSSRTQFGIWACHFFCQKPSVQDLKTFEDRLLPCFVLNQQTWKKLVEVAYSSDVTSPCLELGTEFLVDPSEASQLGLASGHLR